MAIIRFFKEEKKNIVETDLSAQEILNHPLINKGTAFTREERSRFKMDGLLPYNVSTIEQQIERRYQNFSVKKDDLSKYIFLSALQDRNEVLFYRLTYEHCEEMLPYVYTPTVGDASIDFSYLYAQNRGLFISYPDRDRLDVILSNVPNDQVDIIVITDGSRILGLGDVGIGGMVIPIGKLTLYSLFGGIHPGRSLPIFIDVGTNNRQLLEDPLYIGWKNPRIEGREYDDFIQQIVEAIKKRFPTTLLQWEDFAKPHAQQLLNQYQHEILSFNDDIQGTAAAALSAILSGLKVRKDTICDEIFFIVGGGSAGIGIAHAIHREMKRNGLEDEDAYNRIFIFDIQGLVHEKLKTIDETQKPFTKKSSFLKKYGFHDQEIIQLEEATEKIKPGSLIGVSGQQGIFTEKIVKAMSNKKRPMVFPLSNPTNRAEATPDQLVEWTKGKVITATGSPFPNVLYQNQEIQIGQCNNVYIFPGLGLAAIAAKPKWIPNEAFDCAAETLAEFSPMCQNPNDKLFPSIKQLRTISREIAIQVFQFFIKEGLCTYSGRIDPSEVIDQFMWYPNYPEVRNKE